ncbi:transcription-repair coupling factor [Candidatus Nitronereus thalassa]|uniref:Transcription-repair-coupling factor n=1 Tax=Candidatus Nitronereus thalassa TaxID=3020898 RepID=A0ABU3K9J3_9BACT|nr:transcription-repair coupling factor [Candidatus Nitronereus thalassa]MDT7043085.1 transcription-repair coupling factor [Candidatus Nitronereus thalassa]
MSIRTLEIETFQSVVEALGDSTAKPFLVGPHGESLAFTISLLANNLSGPGSSAMPLKNSLPLSWIILTPTQEEAAQLYQDLRFFYTLFGRAAETLAFFPNRGTMPYEDTAPSEDLVAQRMRTLFRLQEQKPTLVITTPEAVLQRLVPHSIFQQSCLTLKVGSVIDREPFITQLLRLGYRRVSVVEIPGEFSVRGGIVDIFSTAESEPYRIEFLGDSVESTRRFDPVSQESTETVSLVQILPAREYLVPPDRMEAELPIWTPDAEWRSPELYPSMDTLRDYFSEAPMMFLDRPLNLAHEAQTLWEGLLEAWEQQEQSSTGPPYPEPDAHFLIWEEFLGLMASSPMIATDVVPPVEGEWSPVISVSFQSPKSVGLGLRGTSFTETLKILERLRLQGPVTVVVRSAGQVGRLLALFAEHQAPAMEGKPPLKSITTEREPFYIQQGYLSSGFLVQDTPFAIVTEDDLFAKVSRHRPQPKSKTAAFLSSLEDLNAGDYVVHVQHGISRYNGLRHLSVQGFESDYLILEFAGKDTLYVPLDRINQVQKYRGGEHTAPKLDRLGGTSWAKTKARVKKGIEDMTNELVELYASREVTTRRIYSEDSTLAHEFEAAFDYEETPDQIKAIEDIQRDLELAKPMDRLVCGDVGYGKTEVAMRAAFKAVQDNRQVAVLVPTTLLAQQHYETFCRRFAPFPVRVGILSRFQSPKEVKALLPDLASGVVDIVIGTHRVLQKNVQFKNLGLVIIDEEQWFGVRHKERMKQLRTQVDVLTLTATPIPRTLQMAFSGVRDLSVIETPPSGRLAIRTHVLRFNPTVIREAIRRELARAGQIFFVHNRVQSMERIATWLQDLVPEARILMAHGQMNEHVLEGVMLKFFHGEADILVASAIIQSGLDVPRANTILVDRADTFGLAQLYQLRGRVGRAGDQAYAYFFFPNEEVLTTDAQKRLMAIQEFAELGSGFRIAAADLEIRGAGNLLGKQQSGNMAAVGLDLYMQMVEQAVQKMKGQEVEEELDPTLHLNVSAFIPDDYVEDAHQRLSLYKRLSASQKIGDLALLHEETQDRYGPLPDAVERLFEVMQIRLFAKKLRLESLEVNKGKITLTLDAKATIPQESLDWLMQYTEDTIQFLSPQSLAIQTGHEEWGGQVEELNRILQGLLNAPQESVQV